MSDAHVPEPPAGRRLRWAVAAAGAGLLALGAAVVIHEAAASSTTIGRPVPIVDRGTLPGSGSGAPPAAAGGASAAGRPVRHAVPVGSLLHYERLGISARIVDVTTRRGVMDVPQDPKLVGWWRDGAGAGDAAGSVVVVGHINYAGTAGALGVLPHARPGDLVTVAEPGHHVIGYRVQAVRTYPKTAGIPAAAFDRAGSPRLVLITCGGPFDPSTGNYEDNIVVYANPT